MSIQGLGPGFWIWILMGLAASRTAVAGVGWLCWHILALEDALMLGGG